MLIDWDTANNLELLRSNLDYSPKNSLFGKTGRFLVAVLGLRPG